MTRDPIRSFLPPALVAIAAAVAVAAPPGAQALDVRVTVENLAPANGTFLTPVWVGFHNGGFDLYDRDLPATQPLERIAEDGVNAPMNALFTATGSGLVQGTVGGGPIAPGAAPFIDVSLDGTLPSSRYFSYASMIIPSNDAFIANGNPFAHRIFDAGGNFLGASFIVLGNAVLDAGTEVNDEVPANTAFFGQLLPDTGIAQDGVIVLHAGFRPPGSGGILDSATFANGDFTAAGYQVARITIAPVPEPGTWAMLLAGLAGLGWVARRRVRHAPGA